MSGFAGRGLATSVHDDLTATALVFEAGSVAGGERRGVAIVACDLIGIEQRHCQVIQRAAVERSRLPLAAVLLCCSHTHYGPAGPINLFSGEAENPYVEPYLTDLVEQVATAVEAAASQLEPCRVSAAQGSAPIGVNRRRLMPDGRILMAPVQGPNPEGFYDPRVLVIRVDSLDGRPLAVMINAACHPVTLGDTCTAISADYPGVARRLVEEATGATCLFLQGAAGNINPKRMDWGVDPNERDWSWDIVEDHGRTLAAETLRIHQDCKPDRTPADGLLAVRKASVSLPQLLPETLERAQQIVTEAEAAAASATASAERSWTDYDLRRARKNLAVLRGGAPFPSIPAPVTAIRIGSQLALMTAPAEPFAELGRSVTDCSPFPHTAYVGYTNGYLLYVPTKEAYHQGGYETSRACQVGPGAGEHLVGESLRLLEQLSVTTS